MVSVSAIARCTSWIWLLAGGLQTAAALSQAAPARQASGMSVAEIVDAYPTLSEDAVQAALRELGDEKEAAAA